MSNLFNKFIHSRSGSAAVMVLSVILILTALGTVALMGSVSSIKMGARYQNWSKEFYDLDKTTEDYVNQVDKELQQAEQAARNYMENEKFKDITYTDTYMDPASQAFFVNNCWMNNPSNTYDAYVIAHPGDSSSDIETNYKTALQDGYKECFEKLYFYYLSHRLNLFITGLSPNSPVYEKTPANSIDKFLVPTAATMTWTNYSPTVIAPIYLVVRTQDPDIADKSVEAELKITNPEYKAIVKTAFLPIRGNPLWGYALAAGGSINVAGTPSNLIQVSGDIAAAGGDLSILQNEKLDVYGNIYTSGDVKISGDNGELHVFNHTTTSSMTPAYAKKKGIYDQSELGINQADTTLFDSTFAALIEPLASPAVPFFYRDLWESGWGNVYCNNLMIEDSVQSGKLTVDGNVTTSDDVEMNGLQNNTITIGGNYVGISSEGAPIEGTGTIDPNTSSTIFNNQVLNDTTGVDLNNHINLNGNIIVPGTVFREFDAPDRWYQTIESVTGRDRSIFNAYVADPDDPTAEIHNLTTGSVTDSYAIKSLNSDIDIRRQDFTNSLSSSGITTNVFGTAGMTGYSSGAIVTQTSGTTAASIHVKGYNPVAGFVQNQGNWQIAKAPSIIEGGTNKTKLHTYFDAKTKTFGFYNRPFSSLVDTGVVSSSSITAMGDVKMYYLTGSSTFDITAASSGIVYCAGDLTLKGTGTFKGIIIASGNITLSPADGAFNIQYYEDAVNKIMSDEKAWAVRAFFQNGMIGHDDYAFSKNFQAVGATKSFMKRYSISKWQEVQLP